jgi:ribosomal protein S6
MRILINGSFILSNTMATLTLKGHTFNQPLITNSFSRRSQFFANKIAEILGQLDISPEAVEVDFDPIGIKKLPASVEWYMDGHYLFYKYDKCAKAVDNLAVICKLLELEVAQVVNGHKQRHEFVAEFSADEDHEEQKKEARELLGVSEDEKDMTIIDKKYKDLAKAAHPDMPTGDAEKFKALNKAHKLLRKELH